MKITLIAGVIVRKWSYVIEGLSAEAIAQAGNAPIHGAPSVILLVEWNS
jgi:hypothetical protein